MFNLERHVETTLDSINKRHAEAIKQMQMSLEIITVNLQEAEKLHKQSSIKLDEINKMLDGLNF